MNVRVVGVMVLALGVGAGAGYAVAAQDEPLVEPRASFTEPSPLPANDPSLPVVVISPDPDDPQLEIGIPLDTQRLVALDAGKPTKQRLTLPVPKGWTRGFNGVSRWTFSVPGNDVNSYAMRVDLFQGPPLTLDRAIGARQAAMRSAETEGNFVDLEFEDETSDGFVASYVFDGFRRVSMERFFSGPDPTQAYASVVVYGREQDRPGMAFLLDLIARDLRTG